MAAAIAAIVAVMIANTAVNPEVNRTGKLATKADDALLIALVPASRAVLEAFICDCTTALIVVIAVVNACGTAWIPDAA